MNPEAQPEHCGHERVCWMIRSNAGVFRSRLTPCNELENCKDDTRKIKERPRPPCEECIYQSQSAEHDAAVAKAERERVLDEVSYAICGELTDTSILSNFDCSDIRKLLNSIRGKP